MSTQEIARSEWKEFFDTFSRQHEGWRTTIEVVGGTVGGSQLGASELPLAGISADVRGGQDLIEVMLGETPQGRLTHVIENAARVMFEQSHAGEHAGLLVETADGEQHILQFRVAARPELLDGTIEERRRKAGG